MAGWQVVQAMVAAAVAAAAIAAAAYFLSPAREGYGPPPGMGRAATLGEIAATWNRGWAVWPEAYNANTASSISHMVMRSA